MSISTRKCLSRGELEMYELAKMYEELLDEIEKTSEVDENGVRDLQWLKSLLGKRPKIRLT